MSALRSVCHARIAGVASVVPARQVLTSDLPEQARRASKLTRVAARRIAPQGVSTERYGLSAARLLLRELELAPGHVDRLVYVTQTPGSHVPSGAHDIHASLGLREDCPPTEVNWSCAGYVHGLWLAATLGQMHADVCRTLVVAGDLSSRLVNQDDTATGPLFGDAVTATLVESGQGVSQRMAFCLSTGADDMGGLHKDHGKPLYMDGPEVAAMVLSRVPPLVREALDFAFCNGMPTPAAFAFHQANAFLLDQLARKLRLREVYGAGCLPSNISRYGNCSSASIPLLLCDTDAWRDSDRHGAVVMTGFGAGWSAGVTVADLRETSVLVLAEE